MRLYINKLKQVLVSKLGMDRAIAASSLTQMIRFVTGPITMVLMIRHFTPEEQGFFYSFAGVIGLQVFLEAGFAQSITQFTSKEFASLRFNTSGALTGDPAALSRLRSLLAQSNRYYCSMAAVLTVALSIGGYWFFSSKSSHGVPWHIPWFVVCFTSGLGFLLTPYWAFLVGCNRVAQVATYRFWATLVGFTVTATGLILGFGIYVVVYGALFNLVFPIVYLTTRWRKLLLQVLRPPGKYIISWREDIWGFQWRIALTWMSRYFLESGIAPLAFQISGPLMAGKIGMTFQVVRMIGGISNTWTATKIPYWGALAAGNRWEELEFSWRSAARRNVLLTFIGLLAFVVAFPLLNSIWPTASNRFLAITDIAYFSVGWFFYSFWLVSMHYTRALRQEPYTFLHVAVGLVFLSGCLLLYKNFGDSTIPLIFCLVHIVPAYIAVRLRGNIRNSLLVQKSDTYHE
ncbi:hypothetical protein [Rubritalea profundi]|uniref:Polysaccharide biosynthesis protein n=1 Tax=Rubritalea profundi TaxID=1658618 RepID=A0A2S7U183_9BACT|nr:hypothetical protein [Rubritalea profundi]PQJ28092.1 hypothetical protein BSZ32_05950 [Rubritalea profundi]